MYKILENLTYIIIPDENEKVTYQGSSVGDMPVFDKVYAWYP